MKNNLTTEQIEFACSCMSEWFEICKINAKEIDSSFVQNSSLLRRLLSGKEAHLYPPPLRFGFPAYELVESEEIQVQYVQEKDNNLIIDGHEGYIWIDKSENILQYKRLKLNFKLIEKEIIPDAICVREGDDPKEYKYTVKFLQRIAK
jgi:hypothetical protein